MTRLTFEASISVLLNYLSEMVELRDERVRLLGCFDLAGPTAAFFTSPFSDEELEKYRRQRTGRPLKDILEQLGPV